MNKLLTTKLFAIGVVSFLIFEGCSGKSESTEANAEEQPAEVSPMENKGIGPVSKVEMGELNQEWVAEGEKIYNEKCTSCHKPYEKYIGPAQAGVLERRSPEWVMNMILNPTEMVEKDPIAKELLKEFLAPMANQNLTEDQARKVVEYFRTLKSK